MRRGDPYPTRNTRLRLPPFVTGTLTTASDPGGCAIRLAGEVPGGLELLAPPGRRFPSSLQTGMVVHLAFELPSSVALTDARVQQASATYLRVALLDRTEEAPRRRRHTRTRLTQTVAVAVTDRAGNETRVAAVLVDVSLGGCQLRFDDPPETGSTVVFDADLGGRARLRGTVVRRIPTASSTGSAVGVRFGGISFEARAALERLVSRGQGKTFG